MKELLVRFLRLVIDEPLGLTSVQTLELSNLLWNYHRAAAKSQGYQTTKGGRFMEFSDKYPQVERQRGAVDILSEMAKHNIVGPLDDVYINALKDLLLKLEA